MKTLLITTAGLLIASNSFAATDYTFTVANPVQTQCTDTEIEPGSTVCAHEDVGAPVLPTDITFSVSFTYTPI